MFDIYKGWPYDGAINDNGTPKNDEGIKAGMFITKDSNGLLIKALGEANEAVFVAIHKPRLRFKLWRVICPNFSRF